LVHAVTVLAFGLVWAAAGALLMKMFGDRR
jgi:hypothetical protein